MPKKPSFVKLMNFGKMYRNSFPNDKYFHRIFYSDDL